MKKTLILTLILLFGLLCSPAEAWALSAGDITAEAAVLMDAGTGQILYAKNMDRTMYPASITKILTGLLAMEYASPAEVITVSGSAVDLPRNTSHIALTEGERITVDEAMYAMLLPSANDAANALAEHVSGSQEAFAELMNRKAAALGATGSHFANAHGLPDVNHYTTALDMALITRAAARNEDFLRYFGTTRHTMSPTNRQEEERFFTNQQYMLLPDMWVYDPTVLGGKVGWTTEARHTMSTVARRDGRTLVCVVLGSGIDDKFYDTEKLLDYGFGEFVEYTIPSAELEAASVPIEGDGAEVGYAAFRAEEDIHLLLHRSIDPRNILRVYDYPALLARDGPMEGYLLLEVEEAGLDSLPSLLMRVPLTPEVTMLGMVDAAEQEPPLPEQSGGILRLLLRVAVVAAIVAAGLFALLVLVRIRVRRTVRRRRRKRREELLRRRREPDTASPWE